VLHGVKEGSKYYNLLALTVKVFVSNSLNLSLSLSDSLLSVCLTKTQILLLFREVIGVYLRIVQTVNISM
jgi:hypothetical protein